MRRQADEAGSLTVEDRFERLLEEGARDGFDVRVTLDAGVRYAWSCELAYTAEPNRDDHRPDRSHVVYAVGGADPLEVLERCLDELKTWRREGL